MRRTSPPAALLTLAAVCAPAAPAPAQTLSELVERRALTERVDPGEVLPLYDRCYAAADPADKLPLATAREDLARLNLAMTVAILGATVHARQDRTYERLLKPELDEIGADFLDRAAAAQARLRDADCAGLAESMSAARQDLLHGYALFWNVTDTYETARTLPEVEIGAAIPDAAAVDRSAGRVVLRVGDGFGQIFLRDIDARLGAAGFEVEVHAGAPADRVQAYFYGNYFPDRPYREEEIAALVEILTSVARHHDLIGPAPDP